MKIYTRTGDDGTTGLFSGQRVSKNHLRMEVCGTLDELNAHLGAALAGLPDAKVSKPIREVQSHIFSLGADIATTVTNTPRISSHEIAGLEWEIDQMTEELPELRNFILPGGTPAAAQIHIARAVCRRCERLLVTLASTESVPPDSLRYLNRLSDFLFVLARYENSLTSTPEEKWVG